MAKPGDKNGMLGRYGVRSAWMYWAAVAGMFVFLIIDIVDDGAIWNYVTIAFVIIAIAVRPGGIRGPRAAAAADDPAPSAAAAADEPAPRPT
jgi:hypothetical protein